MGLISNLAGAANIPIKRSGNMELIAAEDAVAFLASLERNGMYVLGVEGFRFEGTNLVPDMDAIADFSELSKAVDVVSQTASEARRFLLKTARPGMYYDFTVKHVGKV